MRGILLLAAGLVHLFAHAQRLPLPPENLPFSEEQLLRGVEATHDQCRALQSAVWAALPDGTGECLRFWSSGLDAPGVQGHVLVYLTGDQISNGRAEASYVSRTPAAIESLVAQMRARAAVPFILLARPGTFGSSGDHRERRREREPRLVSGAFDALKARFGFSQFGVAGLSGGGHIVASLLAWRDDIVCAVAASAVSSPRTRWRMLGMQKDVTGFDDSFEPVDHLAGARFHPRLRVFVLGDPADTNTPWKSQQPLAHKLKEMGVAAFLVEGQGAGVQRHILGNSAQAIAAMCLRGIDTETIMKDVADLKG